VLVPSQDDIGASASTSAQFLEIEEMKMGEKLAAKKPAAEKLAAGGIEDSTGKGETGTALEAQMGSKFTVRQLRQLRQGHAAAAAYAAAGDTADHPNRTRRTSKTSHSEETDSLVHARCECLEGLIEYPKVVHTLRCTTYTVPVDYIHCARDSVFIHCDARMHGYTDTLLHFTLVHCALMHCTLVHYTLLHCALMHCTLLQDATRCLQPTGDDDEEVGGERLDDFDKADDDRSAADPGDDDDGTVCTAHSDCGVNAPLCFESICTSCDACHFCMDGIDGTCSPCDAASYPTFEVGADCALAAVSVPSIPNYSRPNYCPACTLRLAWFAAHILREEESYP
jgi:hypothetical protein